MSKSQLFSVLVEPSIKKKAQAETKNSMVKQEKVDDSLASILEEEQFACIKCNQKFSNQNNLHNHNNLVHL